MMMEIRGLTLYINTFCISYAHK